MSKANEPLYNLSLVKSNDMISAKYKATLLENQVMAIALTRIEVNEKDKEHPLVARLYPRELKKLVSDDRHIYRDLKDLAKTITGHTMFLEDGKGNFKAFSVVPNAIYKDGVFSIIFNSELKEHILGLEKNYTTLELSVMTDFERNSSFRIYELLKKDLYKSKPDVNDGRVDVQYNLSEFRFMIGLANGDDPIVAKVMARQGQNIDWDAVYAKLPKDSKKYDPWYEVQRNVLRPAQKELKEKSDIRFEYEGLKNGKKTAEILFHIYPNKPSMTVISKTKVIEREQLNRQLEIPYDLEQFAPLYDEFIGHNELTKEDIDLLLVKADYDSKKVIAAIDLADEQPHVYNYMGFLIRAIEEGYSQTFTINGDAEKGAGFVQFKEAYREGKRTGDIQKAAWERIQKNDDFQEFEAMIIENGLTIEQLVSIYTLDEVIKFYSDWKFGRPLNF